ncbi:MAG: ThiF family adenylyltransferase [Anaerolineae bacterium]|nr:ThiF family adenylyltransferase [Anaerolineae bacterium]
MNGIFDPNTYIKTITLVGVGGTGASTARIVARILYDMQRARQHTPSLVLIDPDRVDEKNIGRQALFAPADIGQFKAECVARRLNAALGLNIGWIAEPLDPERHAGRFGSNLVISCVDNHEARRAVHRMKGIVLAGGNHADAGQVCIGNTDDPELLRRFIDGRDGKYPYLPKEGLLFPALLEPEPEPERPLLPPGASCAELVDAGYQHLLINDWIATVIGTYVYKLLHRQPISSFVSYVSADGMSVRSVAICRDELLPYLQAEV